MLQKIRTVLIHNSHPGNIGSTARAMKNMGLENLYLVAPKRFPAKEAFYMASKADDVVERATVVENVHQALEGCTLVFGASSRTRALKWREISPRQAAKMMMEELQQEKHEQQQHHQHKHHHQHQHHHQQQRQTNPLDQSSQIAILYGCEQHGLSNEELELSHYQIVIPARPDYASLNVAQAVQLISYEIYVAYLELLEQNACEEPSCAKEAPYATLDEMERFYKHLEETLLEIQFIFEERPGLMMSRLRRLFAAARLDKVELQILRGILTAVQKKV